MNYTLTVLLANIFLTIALTSSSFCVANTFFRENNLYRMLGSLALLPLIVYPISILLPTMTERYAVIDVANIFFLSGIIPVLMTNPEKRFAKQSRQFVLMTTLILIAFILSPWSKPFLNFISVNSVFFSGVPVAVAYFIIKRVKAKSSNLLQATCLMLFSSEVIRYISSTGSAALLALVLSSIGWFCYNSFLRMETNRALNERVKDTERRMREFDLTLNHELKKRLYHFERLNENLLHISKTDHLTKALNKNAIITMINQLIESRSVSRFSILIFDIDHFKQINDRLGHLQGDIALKRLSAIAKSCLRENDKYGRYGGDEFIITLPHSNINEARSIAERFRKLVAANDEQPKLTVSIGIACFPDDGITTKDLIEKADQGLYIAKQKGRNAVAHAKE